MPDAIKARLQLKYPGFSLDLDLRLPGRGVSALFGPSGSGKTTVLRCLAGLVKAPQAYVQINGEVWQDSQAGVFVPPHKRPIGYVFQEASLFAHLSVRKNLEYGWQRISTAERRVQLQSACELLGISALLDRQPLHLSGGERQRVGIARALLTSPRLLLMDEPLAALDSQRKAEILPYLERLHDELDIPVVYVSHSHDEVARLADHLALIEGGKLLACGPVGETFARLDLPIALHDDAGVVVEGRVCSYDSQYQLLSLKLPNSSLQVKVAHAALPMAARLRFKVRARDISLSLTGDAASSILNRLPVTITALTPTDNAAHVMVGLDAAGTPLLARITRYSSDTLELKPGKVLWAQIKSVAVLA
ncbi:molybdenum ABC transporter ATP-binding protein [Pseudomonas sp. HR96]|uniref:molybdenum ABC transporter ATP-binding protein n=1 Tax=Pseudomonas sp. HR96 TaxID=1027966 RepID=UPI002A75839F|nr:molybdenum ABC transporter ATP-binding protein [Pseudomonas sp. HR96]WPP01837.1 molybdenum ABC transporter ATP-binding protein [Pseudomonas sp. HR96]